MLSRRSGGQRWPRLWHRTWALIAARHLGPPIPLTGGDPTGVGRVLVVVNDPDSVGALTLAVERLSERASQIVVAAPYDVESALRVAAGGRGGFLARDLAAAAASHGPAFRRALHAAGPREKLLVYLRNDAWIDHWLHHADVVAGLDPVAIESLGRLLRQRGERPLATTVDEALGCTRALASPTDLLSGQMNAPADARPYLAEAERDATDTGQLERARLAAAAAIEALMNGDESRAEAVVRAALAATPDPRLRADLLGDVVWWSLARGLPIRLTREAYAAELASADNYLAKDQCKLAASSFMEAVRTAFHPALHMHRTSSPLAEDPEGYTAPLRASSVAEVLRGGKASRKGRSVCVGAVTPSLPSGRPLRLLIGTHSDDTFLHTIRAHFATHPAVELRSASFAESPAIQRFGKRQAPFVAEVLSRGSGLPASLEESFREHLDWADLFFVEWFTALAALMGQIDRGDTRVAVRMHSWEAFSWWPHLVDVHGFDDVVFVSEHLRDFALRAIPGLGLEDGPRLHVLANAMNLKRLVRPKPNDARFTVGVVGASRVVKDPRWAVDVVRHLRQRDDRYRLRLIRGAIEDEGPATRTYVQELRREIDALPEGAVEATPHTDELPEALQDVGVVLSSSVRESFHIGLIEGVASGALPVVRNWPYFPGAASRLFPDEWVVDTPAEAADRILSYTCNARKWRVTAEAAAALVQRTWDWSVVRKDYEQLILG